MRGSWSSGEGRVEERRSRSFLKVESEPHWLWHGERDVNTVGGV